MSDDLHTLFNPRSIVLVGASEKSAWSNTAQQNLRDFDYPGKLYYVNRKGSDVYGRKGATRISEIGEPVDLALLMVPAAVLEESLNEMHAAGIRQGVVLASGYSETGAAGRAAQDALVAQARRLGITLLGPNCVGYLNYAGRAPPSRSRHRCRCCAATWPSWPRAARSATSPASSLIARTSA